MIPAGCAENTSSSIAGETESSDFKTVNLAHHRELQDFFESHEYRWDNLHEGVPAFILKNLPEDLENIPEIRTKKRLFFLSLLPMVLIINDHINQQRKTLLVIYQQIENGERLSKGQKSYLANLAREYKVKGNPLISAKARTALLKRVDILPPSIILAQAATESAYGTSRFARVGNNLFGEWTFKPGTGLIPDERPEGATYEVRRFESLYESLQSYMNNINTHWAYRTLREKRAQMRAQGLVPKGVDLAQGLELYSERREAYVEDIRKIIRLNRLSLLSTTTLRKS